MVLVLSTWWIWSGWDEGATGLHRAPKAGPLGRDPNPMSVIQRFNQGAEREQDGDVQRTACVPGAQLGLRRDPVGLVVRLAVGKVSSYSWYRAASPHFTSLLELDRRVFCVS